MIKKNNIFIWLFILISLTTYNFYSEENSINHFFKIKKIEIFGVSDLKKKEIEDSVDPLKGKNIIFVNIHKVKKLLKKFDFVEEFKVKKIYPDRIEITVKELKPIGILMDKNKQFILLEYGKSIEGRQNKNYSGLPYVYGENAKSNFFIFHKSLKDIDFKIELIKEFKYFDINRWDIVLKNGKLIRLPSVNYKESLKKFLNIYTKDNFKKFNVFDFRVKGQLILK